MNNTPFSLEMTDGKNTKKFAFLRAERVFKVRECLGFADSVLIKTIFGNGDLESSQWGIGRPGANGMVSVVARDIPFLTEIFGAGVAEAEKAQNVG